jgi:hypothetical protein
MITLIHQMRRKPVLDSTFAVSQAPGEKRHTDELVRAGAPAAGRPGAGRNVSGEANADTPITEVRARGRRCASRADGYSAPHSRWVIVMMSSPQLVRRQTFLARSRGSPAVETCKRTGAAPSRRLPKPPGPTNNIVRSRTGTIPRSPKGFRATSLEGGHSHRLRTFRSLADLELDSLILLKGAKTARLDLRMVDEHIFCAAVRGDKSETLLAVEPFHSSLRHTNFSLFKVDVI